MTKKSRTEKRSRSGAQTPCPHCGKMLRGDKGMKMHLAERHEDKVINVKAGAR